MQRMSPFREAFENRVNNLTSEIESLKQENERLQAEIVRLSDPFLHAPDDTDWFAVNKDGYAMWWDKEPFLIDDFYWEPKDRSYEYESAGYYPELAANWKNTKVKRVRNK